MVWSLQEKLNSLNSSISVKIFAKEGSQIAHD